MPIIEVLIQAVDEGGDPIWAYHHRAVFIAPPVDAEANALRLVEELNRRIADGTESIAGQVSSDLAGGRLSTQQEAAGDCPDCGHSPLIHTDNGCDARLPGGGDCSCSRTREAALHGQA